MSAAPRPDVLFLVVAGVALLGRGAVLALPVTAAAGCSVRYPADSTDAR